MVQHLEYLLERARAYRKENGFSDEERDRQVRSFAYGNTRLENEQITKVDVDDAIESLRPESDRTVVYT
jgi:hypothetical protein